MINPLRLTAVSALVTVLAASALAQPAEKPHAETPAASETLVAPPPGFEECTACHGVTKDAPPSIGPNLWGVAGRGAGTGPDYPYSPALKAYGVVWTSETLQPFVANPMGAVPGTTMAYPGLADPAVAKRISDYVMTLRD